MSDDDVDKTPVILPDVKNPDVKNPYVSKSSKYRTSSLSDDDNIEITGQLGDIDKEFERTTQEVILKSLSDDNTTGSKNTKKSKQNDDSDKSDSDSSIFSASGIWDGVQDDMANSAVDVDQLLGDMKHNRNTRNTRDFDEAGFDNSQLEDLSNKIDEISTSVDNLEESFGELNKKFDKMNRNIKKILDMMNILAGNPESIKSKKYDPIDVNDKNDPVNNKSYFDIVSFDNIK